MSCCEAAVLGFWLADVCVCLVPDVMTKVVLVNYSSLALRESCVGGQRMVIMGGGARTVERGISPDSMLIQPRQLWTGLRSSTRSGSERMRTLVGSCKIVKERSTSSESYMLTTRRQWPQRRRRKPNAFGMPSSRSLTSIRTMMRERRRAWVVVGSTAVQLYGHTAIGLVCVSACVS